MNRVSLVLATAPLTPRARPFDDDWRMPSPEHPRIVIASSDPAAIWDLPEAIEYTRASSLSGGQQSLHELAVAARVAGYEVEVRGEYSPALYDRLEAATGVRPETPSDRRRPQEGDIVITDEGGWDPLRFGRLVLSPARTVLGVFAPPALFGWPFAGHPRHLDPLTLDLDDLARPEHFQAMAALGVAIFTPMRRLHDLAWREGVHSHLIGSGTPLAPPAVAVKDIEVAYLERSRWRELAEQAVSKLSVPVHAIGVGRHEEVVAQIARAKVLVWPARIEGHGRVLWEARASGTIVVALSSNVFATGLGDAGGSVAVDSIEEIPAAVESLLADDARRDALAQVARESALEQVDWQRYVERVDRAIQDVWTAPVEAATDALQWFGRRITDLLSSKS